MKYLLADILIGTLLIIFLLICVEIFSLETIVVGGFAYFLTCKIKGGSR